MAMPDGPRRWSKTKDSIVEAFKTISEVADQEAREGEAELEQLRTRSAKVDNLQQENDRLRKELEVALKDLDERRLKDRIIPASDADSSEEYSPESQRIRFTLRDEREKQDAGSMLKRSTHDSFDDWGNRDLAVQTLESEAIEEEFPYKVSPMWTDERLEQKYNELMPRFMETSVTLSVLRKNFKVVSDARQKLEDQVRKYKDNINEFIHITNALHKKNNKLKAEISACPHGHRDVSSPELPSRKVLRRSGNMSRMPDSDDDILFHPQTTYSDPSLPPLPPPAPTIHSDLSLPPKSRYAASALVSTSPSAKTSGEPKPHSPQVVLESEAMAAAVVLPTDHAPPGDAYHDEILINEDALPLGFDEPDPNLPELKYGGGNSPMQQSNHISSTQGEPYTMQQDIPDVISPAIKSEGSSPVLVRTQRVQKSRSRRANASNAAINDAVKVEEISSSPIGPVGLDFGESIDLDDHPHMVTPRKRKTPTVSHRASPSRLSILNDADGDLLSKSIGVPRPNVILVERSPDKSISNALQPKSSNKLLFRQIDDDRPPQKRQRKFAPPAAIASLAEDNIDFQEEIREIRGLKTKGCGLLSEQLKRPTSSSSAISPGTTPGTAKSASRRTLTPATSPPLSGPSFKASSKLRRGPLNLTISRLSKIQLQPKIASSGNIYDIPSSSPRPGNLETTSKASKHSKKKPRERGADSPVDDHPEDLPLRCRQVKYLNLDNFKVNPSYNQGYKHAFSEVVRNKDDRRCLPGCERPCCAPQFRKLAEMTISARIGPSSDAVQESDKRAIMNYLGDNYHKYSRMSAEKKEETLILAMARQLATDHGKHRHAYGRRESPPGFWDVDFPETQEAVANKAAALQAERLRVEERYREAMRPGGAYIFKDE